MPEPKIDPKKLVELREQGMSGVAMAQYFNVSPAAISKSLKKLDMALAVDIATRTAPEIVDDKLDAIEQLKKISRSINKELDYIEQRIKNASARERKDLEERKLKHAQEIRKQVNLMIYIASTMYNLEEVAKFQAIVLEEIGNADEETKARIIKRLKAERSLRRSLDLIG
jgi:predicted transcriptional regulator